MPSTNHSRSVISTVAKRSGETSVFLSTRHKSVCPIHTAAPSRDGWAIARMRDLISSASEKVHAGSKSLLLGTPTLQGRVQAPRIERDFSPWGMLSFAAATLLALPLAAQQRGTIYLDAAHGATDNGARINTHLAEKDITLAVTQRLKNTLTQNGFTIITSRDSDVAIAPDQRSETASRTHAIACITIHATGTGKGVHIFTSSLNEDTNPDHKNLILWDTAQLRYLDQSQLLASQLAASFGRARIPSSNTRSAVRPLGSFSCPAVALELAPGPNDEQVTDGAYQQRVVDAITAPLLFWHGKSDLPAKAASAATGSTAKPAPVGATGSTAPTISKPKPITGATGSTAPITPRPRPTTPAGATGTTGTLSPTRPPLQKSAPIIRLSPDGAAPAQPRPQPPPPTDPQGAAR